VIRRVAMEPVYLNHLRSILGIAGVKRVAMHEPLTSLYAVIAIQCARGTPETEIWRALYGAASLHRFAGKWIVAVDEDIDAENADALLWAMSYRCQPQHDLKVVPHKDPGHGPRGPRDDGESASVLINCHAQRPLCTGRLAEARVHGASQGDLGAAWAAAAHNRSRHGTAMISAIGRPSSSAKLRWRRAASILSSARRLPMNGALMFP